ncbi:MAG: DUF362 domain-containing protein [Candidatus Cloacimonetes bacterium]|nr:DUF362 domain-containing protein [Candidatus Cloacimonadota bacterium]
MNAKVQIRKMEGYDLQQLQDAVASYLKSVRNPKLNRAKRVLIKPNLLGAYPPHKAVTTHPMVVEAIIRHFLDKGKEVWVGDSPGGTVAVESVWETCGYKDLARRYPIKLVNLSTMGFREIQKGENTLRISEAFWRCGIIINVAKYKTHSLMAYTGALKNLYGLVPGLIKSDYHRQHPDTNSFARLLLDLWEITRKRITYNFIDGIMGMDGAGPSAGNPRYFGLFFGSESVPAVDYIASKMMGFRLHDIPYMHDALHTEGILPSRIQIPTSFKDYPVFDADLGVVKLRKDLLKYLPEFVRKGFHQLYYKQPVISEDCKRCGICVRSCPVKAIAWQEDGFPKIDEKECIRCMCCHELCPHHAVYIKRSWVARISRL